MIARTDPDVVALAADVAPHGWDIKVAEEFGVVIATKDDPPVSYVLAAYSVGELRVKIAGVQPLPRREPDPGDFRPRPSGRADSGDYQL